MSYEEFLGDIARFDDFQSETAVLEFSDPAFDIPVFVNEFWTSRQRAAHSLHEVSYRACFKPQLPRFFIERLTRPGDAVYDPFLGRGTTAIEAALLGRRPVGTDINPPSEILVGPLSGPYHYNAHMMILYWDLIEESPVFTDEERLRVTNAFAAQFGHAQDQGARRRVVENVRRGATGFGETSPSVGSRHGQWSAISLYCLGRYFNNRYPSELWEQSMEAARWHFASLHHHAWVDGEHDNLFWYNTGMAPVLSYMLLTGDRKPVENGVMANLLRGQEILASGREPDWALNSASIGFLNKAAYLTGDGRYREYLRRTGMDLNIFRLGQSFWPEDDIEPRLPTNLVNQWSIHPIPEPLWQERHSGLPLEDSYLFGSFRSEADSTGDFILVKGMNGASRNAYHTFVVLELRLDGETLLEGYLNQVLTRSEGTVEPVVAMDSELKYRDVVGGTAVVAAEVPRAAFCNWRRTLAQRVGRYALFVDRLTFGADSEELEVAFLWQGKGAWEALPDGGAARIRDNARICMSDPL